MIDILVSDATTDPVSLFVPNTEVGLLTSTAVASYIHQNRSVEGRPVPRLWDTEEYTEKGKQVIRPPLGADQADPCCEA